MANDKIVNVKSNGICDICSSKNYCINRERGVRQCINFNKFPSEKKDKV